MDQARLFIAIVLSLLVFIGWEVFFSDKKQEAPPKETPGVSVVEEAAKRTTPVPEKMSSAASNPMTAIDEMPVTSEKESARAVTVQSPKYTVTISERGAVFTSFILADYRERVEADSPLKELIPQNIGRGSLQTGFLRRALPEDAVFTTPFTGSSLSVTDKPETLSFFWASADGVVVEKRFTFSPETYLIGFKVIVKNGSEKPVGDDLFVSLLGTAPEKTSSYGFEGPSAFLDDKLEQIKIKKIKEKGDYAGNLKWIALENRYFLSSIIPETVENAQMRLSLKEDHFLESRYIQALDEIAPGYQHVSEFHLFFGPKSMDILKGLNNDLDKAINFGWFDVIAKPCLWFMNFIYGFIPNYGIAIIILTIVTKLILWPLGSKSYKSMNEMKKIQPLMAELREKYSNDKKKMNEELMKLYRVYKINPMGGCLPMVVQIPVFIALYRMLYEAIELRHAPFMLWINDLSAPDRLLHFGFSIPFMQPPYGIPVLTLIMGATMLLQQKMSPPPGDPGQAKMMMFMPIIFTVIFINFSSGLVLYWLVNNILSIAQQYYTSKKTA